MPQDVQYDPLTGEISAVVQYNAFPAQMPAHPSRILLNSPQDHIPLHEAGDHKVDISDPFNKHVRRKTPEERIAGGAGGK